jgi:hypothetical protein
VFRFRYIRHYFSKKLQFLQFIKTDVYKAAETRSISQPYFPNYIQNLNGFFIRKESWLKMSYFSRNKDIGLLLLFCFSWHGNCDDRRLVVATTQLLVYNLVIWFAAHQWIALHSRQVFLSVYFILQNQNQVKNEEKCSLYPHFKLKFLASVVAKFSRY